ncbi:MAG: tetratricopeptide repeat protein [Alphaproteobacteria bacterium]|nr:tetratricopeptide repeat protein [Alphaproteobacteria bacterium]
MVQKKKCDAGCGGKCGGNCADNAVQIQQRIFEREVDEELRQEKLINWWKKYGIFVIAGAICIVLGTICHEWYRSWQAKVQIAESDRFENAMVLGAKGDTESALAELEQLAQNGRTGYQYLARLEQAALLIGANRAEEGLAILKDVTADKAMPAPFRKAAIIAYVGHRLDSENTQELRQLIAPLAADKTDAFYGQAVELSAMLDILSGEKEQAVSLLKGALMTDKLAPQIRERLTQLLGDIQK